jgi:hypothetical protein
MNTNPIGIFPMGPNQERSETWSLRRDHGEVEADSSPCAGVRPGSGDAIASAAARSPATEMGLEAFARGPLLRSSSHCGPSCLLFP